MKQLALTLSLAVVLSGPVFGLGERESGGFSYENVRALEVESSTFDVTVQVVRRDRVSMEIRNEPRNYTVYHAVRGDRLVVWVERNFSLFGGFHSGDLIFQVPMETDIQIETSTGDVVASGLSNETVDIETSTGSIQLRDIRSDGDLQTSTGSVTVESSSGEFDIRTSTGSIAVVAVDGPVRARSSTGSQRFESVRGDIDAQTTTGRMEFIRTEGSIHTESSTGKQAGREVLLNGDSRFESTTGDIAIDLTQEIRSLEFDLQSTTGSLRVGEERSQRRLFLGGTGVLLEGKSSTGSQSYF